MNKTSNERIYEVIRSPLVSEKSTFISQFNYYVFKVSSNSTKMEIKKSVNTLNQKGKKKRFRGKVGVRAGIKKAFVKLAEGQTIDTTVEVK